ncbi:MAG: bifunctional molybdenum cofactor biosynthesis protein MoaC/MoaB [Calditrichaeota bacterium]|nr:bifunctional molybdenum cofactor biosynthesis protein MoaC/MoaB [Calditrichota bacterium]
MLDITSKYPTLRTAVAEAVVAAGEPTLRAVREGRVPKGDPLTTARVAGIQAAKNTSAIIPFCHPLAITYADIAFTIEDASIVIRATVKALAPTGVEMEALTAASVAALTIYDMLKMLDKDMEIRRVHLIEKRGGKSDFAETPDRTLRAGVLVMSDSVAAGHKSDRSGQLIVERMKKEGLEVVEYRIIPDDREQISSNLIRFADELRLDLVLTTGGTGFSPRDITPEAMGDLDLKEIPGIPEAIREYGRQRTPYSMLSRGRAGLRRSTLIVNLPGSTRGVSESLDLLFPALLHAFPMIAGAGWGKSR